MTKPSDPTQALHWHTGAIDALTELEDRVGDQYIIGQMDEKKMNEILVHILELKCFYYKDLADDLAEMANA